MSRFVILILWAVALSHVYIGIFVDLNISNGRYIFYSIISFIWVAVALAVTFGHSSAAVEVHEGDCDE